VAEGRGEGMDSTDEKQGRGLWDIGILYDMGYVVGYMCSKGSSRIKDAALSSPFHACVHALSARRIDLGV
jgi:hypothetical protein